MNNILKWVQNYAFQILDQNSGPSGTANQHSGGQGTGSSNGQSGQQQPGHNGQSVHGSNAQVPSHTSHAQYPGHGTPVLEILHHGGSQSRHGSQSGVPIVQIDSNGNIAVLTNSGTQSGTGSSHSGSQGLDTLLGGVQGGHNNINGFVGGHAAYNNFNGHDFNGISNGHNSNGGIVGFSNGHGLNSNNNNNNILYQGQHSNGALGGHQVLGQLSQMDVVVADVLPTHASGVSSSSAGHLTSHVSGTVVPSSLDLVSIQKGSHQPAGVFGTISKPVVGGIQHGQSYVGVQLANGQHVLYAVNSAAASPSKIDTLPEPLTPPTTLAPGEDPPETPGNNSGAEA